MQRHGGTVIKARGEGDSHFAVFDRASSGVRAAVDIQQSRVAVPWPSVRAALHTAEADPRDGDYLGAVVNRTARLRSTAHGGQIVCSRVVADLVNDLDDVTVRTLGGHRVRDIPGEVELFQVGADGLPADFPPLMTLDGEVAPIMTFVVVDQMGSADRVARMTGGFAAWQGGLYRTLRAASVQNDGRFFKFIGDGCLVAFNDPRAALSFGHGLGERVDLAPVVDALVGGVTVSSSWT